MSRRRISETNWGWSEIDIIMDISETFNAELELDNLHLVLSEICMLPRTSEIVWKDPNLKNMNPEVLDKIVETIRPEVYSWIYSEDPEVRSAAFNFASSSTRQWGVRSAMG